MASASRPIASTPSTRSQFIHCERTVAVEVVVRLLEGVARLPAAAPGPVGLVAPVAAREEIGIRTDVLAAAPQLVVLAVDARVQHEDVHASSFIPRRVVAVEAAVDPIQVPGLAVVVRLVVPVRGVGDLVDPLARRRVLDLPEEALELGLRVLVDTCDSHRLVS